MLKTYPHNFLSSKKAPLTIFKGIASDKSNVVSQLKEQIIVMDTYPAPLSPSKSIKKAFMLIPSNTFLFHFKSTYF